MINLTRRSLVTLMTSVAVLLTVGCAPTQPLQAESNPGAGETSPVSDATATGEINLYSSRHYDSDDALYQAFTQQTGIQVNLIEGEADKLIERIQTEGQNSPADVLITVDAGNLWRAEQAGIFQPVSSPVLEQSIPATLRHPQGLWFGFSRRARVIVYNKATVDPSQLSTYEALAEPEWQGRVCVRSSSNIYNQSLVASKIETLGVEETEKWAKSLVSNFAREPEGNDTAQVKAVAQGVCDVGIANHYYVARLIKSDKPEDQEVAQAVGVFFPKPTHVNISGGGVAVNAPNRESAIKFLEFLAGAEAQKSFAEAVNEYPAVSGVPTDAVVSQFGEFASDEVNVASYGKNNPEAVKLMDRVGWK